MKSVTLLVLFAVCVIASLGEHRDSYCSKSTAKCSCVCDCGGPADEETEASVSEPQTEVWFRTASGTGKDTVRAWNSGDGATTKKACRKVKKDSCGLHYRDPRIDTWSIHNITEVKYSIYKKGQVVAWVLFDAVGSNKNNWFEKSRIIASNYDDLTSSASSNFFAINDPSEILRTVTRHWYASNKFAGCNNDDFWFVTIDDKGGCEYDRKAAYPYILYSTKSTMANSGNPESFSTADAAVVTVTYFE